MLDELYKISFFGGFLAEESVTFPFWAVRNACFLGRRREIPKQRRCRMRVFERRKAKFFRLPTQKSVLFLKMQRSATVTGSCRIAGLKNLQNATAPGRNARRRNRDRKNCKYSRSFAFRRERIFLRSNSFMLGFRYVWIPLRFARRLPFALAFLALRQFLLWRGAAFHNSDRSGQEISRAFFFPRC